MIRLRYCCAFLLSLVIFAGVASAENFNSANKPAILSGKQSLNLHPVMASHAKWLNEVSERRRVQTLSPNPQSGLSKGLVNVNKGNVSFERRFLVTSGRMPIVMSLVYDALADGNVGLGDGWRLSYSEIIRLDEFGKLLHTQANGEIKTLRDHVRLSDDIIELKSTVGGVKRFVRMGNTYLLAEQRDRNGNKLSFHYQDQRLVTIDDNAGQSVSLTWQNGHLVLMQDSHGRQARLGYDAKGRLAQVTDLGGNLWQFDYDSHHRLIGIDDPNGQKAAAFKYFNDGKAKFSQVRAQSHHYQYQDRVTKVKDALGHTSVFEHDANGNLQALTNAQGTRFDIEYNSGKPSVLSQDGELQARFDYNSEGLLSLLTTPQSRYRYQYSQQGWPEVVSQQDKPIMQFSYDSHGNLLSIKTPKYQRSYQYNNLGDMLKQTTAYTGLHTDVEDYGYNSQGLVTKIIAGENTTELNYTPIGQLNKITFADGASHEYQYDALGFRVSANQADETQLDYQYDATGSLTNIAKRKHNEAANLARHNTMQINPNNLTTKVKQGDFDALQLIYDTMGNPITSTRNNGNKAYTYQYDKLGRLTSVNNSQGERYNYQYGPTEPDIRWQLDDRSQNLTHAGDSQAGQDLTRYVRASASPWSHIAWSEQNTTLSVILPTEQTNQDVLIQASQQRRRLYDAKAIGAAYRKNFDKPSNAIFRPPEYIYDNCWTGYEPEDPPSEPDPNDYEPPYDMDCTISSVDLNAPTQIIAGQLTSFDVTMTTGTNCMNPVNQYWIGGTLVASGGMSFNHTFPQPGEHTVTVVSECACNPYMTWDFTPVVTVVYPKLTAVAIANPTGQMWTIDQQRNMPNVEFVASHQPAIVPVQEITFHWYATLDFHANNRTFSHRVPASGTVDVTGSNTWSPQWGSLLAGANNMTVYASATFDGQTTATASQSGFQIGGENPSQDDIFKLTTTDEAKAVCWQESTHRQFSGSAYTGSGFPVFGQPDGWGLMQRDPLQAEYQLWDWYRALNDGVNYLNTVRNEALLYLNHWYNQDLNDGDPLNDWPWSPAIRPDLVWDDAFSRYNTGDPIYSPNGNGGVRNCASKIIDRNGNSVGCSYANNIRNHIKTKPWPVQP